MMLLRLGRMMLLRLGRMMLLRLGRAHLQLRRQWPGSRMVALQLRGGRVRPRSCAPQVRVTWSCAPLALLARVK